MHQYRAENWTDVKGSGLVTREEEMLLIKNQSTYTLLGAEHRLETPDKTDIE
jgi:mannose-1-phosphate guanylyltransferase/mannose-6-phosphate isomerase